MCGQYFSMDMGEMGELDHDQHPWDLQKERNVAYTKDDDNIVDTEENKLKRLKNG